MNDIKKILKRVVQSFSVEHPINKTVYVIAIKVGLKIGYFVKQHFFLFLIKIILFDRLFFVLNSLEEVANKNRVEKIFLNRINNSKT